MSKLIVLVMLPLYTYYLSTSDYGYWDILTSSLAFLFPVVSMQITQGVYRYLIDCNDDEEKIKKLISSCFRLIILNLIILNSAGFLVVGILHMYSYIILIIFADIYIMYNAITDITRGLKHNLLYSISGITNTLIMVILNIVLIIFFGMKLEALIISSLVANGTVFLYLFIKQDLYKYLKIFNIDKSVLKELIAFSAPMIPNSVSWWVMNVSDRYLINYFNGSQANGIYAVSNKFPAILMMINSIFYLAWQESAIVEHNSKDRNIFYQKMFNNLMKIQFTVSIILIACLKYIMNVLVHGSFQDAWKYIPFLFLGTVFYSFSAFLGTFNLVKKETKTLFYSSICGAIFNIIFNIIFLKKYGIQAASFSTMIAFIIMFIWRVINTRKYKYIKINKIEFLFLFSFALIVTYFVNIDKLAIDIVFIMLSIILFVIINNKLIVVIFKKIEALLNKDH
jgi:O-antigen/teichoic acid export membrane protein